MKSTTPERLHLCRAWLAREENHLRQLDIDARHRRVLIRMRLQEVLERKGWPFDEATFFCHPHYTPL